MDTLAVQETRDVISRENSRAEPPKKLMTAQAIAERLGVPKSTVYEGARQNRIGGVVRVGRLVRFDPARFEAWLAGGGQALEGGWRQQHQG